MSDSTDGSADPDEEKQEIEVEYITEDHYQSYPATGSRGGIQPNGDFHIDFHTDRFGAPEKDVFEIDEGGIGEFLREEGGNAIERRIQTGVDMSQGNAFKMATWVLAEILGANVSGDDVEDVIREGFSDKFE